MDDTIQNHQFYSERSLDLEGKVCIRCRNQEIKRTKGKTGKRRGRAEEQRRISQRKRQFGKY